MSGTTVSMFIMSVNTLDVDGLVSQCLLQIRGGTGKIEAGFCSLPACQFCWIQSTAPCKKNFTPISYQQIDKSDGKTPP